VKRLAVLASGAGTNLQALLDTVALGELDAEIVVVVSDRRDAGALRRAMDAGVPAVMLPLADRKDADARAVYDRQLADLVGSFDPDVIVLAGWMLILGPMFLERFPGRIVNVHPALLPDDGGDEVLSSVGLIPALRGARVVREALTRKLPVTGATVHVVTSTVDSGPVILREEAPVRPGDDEAKLHARIKRVEHRLLPRGVGLALANLAAVGNASGRGETA
jgi:phosphoribosylglycinamide formyltransferase-1